jgi:hypothetical protein
VPTVPFRVPSWINPVTPPGRIAPSVIAIVKSRKNSFYLKYQGRPRRGIRILDKECHGFYSRREWA